jgi:glutamate racemase
VNQHSIGILDSGVGGLATLRAARRALPNESFIYIGDLARVPYGDKSSAAIREYAKRMVQFLLKHKVKALAVACNTISAVASSSVLGALNTPVFHVLEAGASAALRISRHGRIGVIATTATVREKGYERSILGMQPQASVLSVDCPLLVPLIEEGWQERPLTLQVVAEYLEPFQSNEVDTLVLGCTHYSFIRPAIRSVLGSHIEIADPAVALAEQLARAVKDGAIEPASRRDLPARLTFCVTDHIDRFQRVASRLCPSTDAKTLQVEL